MIRKAMPDVYIAIVNKTKSHKRYFLEETRAAMDLLRRIRENDWR